MADTLVNRGATVNHGDKRDRRPLHWAAFRGHDDLVRLLAQNKGDVNVRDKDGFTPLLAAVASGSVMVVQLLLELDADVRVANIVRDMTITLVKCPKYLN